MSHPAATADDRPLRPALRRGLALRCPNCGEGRMFSRYLRVTPACPACGEDLSHQRADDGPAYLTILLVGHLIAPVLHVAYTRFTPDPLTLALILCAGTLVLSLALLPRIKGMMVGLQWARRMHGFGGAE
jgi:uncharacterized protein (DUF983 family)